MLLLNLYDLSMPKWMLLSAEIDQAFSQSSSIKKRNEDRCKKHAVKLLDIGFNS